MKQEEELKRSVGGAESVCARDGNVKKGERASMREPLVPIKKNTFKTCPNWLSPHVCLHVRTSAHMCLDEAGYTPFLPCDLAMLSGNSMYPTGGGAGAGGGFGSR